MLIRPNVAKKELDENELEKSELRRKCTRRNVTEPFVCNLKFSLEMTIVPKYSVSQYNSEPIYRRYNSKRKYLLLLKLYIHR